jgi:hypothetical protein
LTWAVWSMGMARTCLAGGSGAALHDGWPTLTDIARDALYHPWDGPWSISFCGRNGKRLTRMASHSWERMGTGTELTTIGIWGGVWKGGGASPRGSISGRFT